MHVLVTGGTGFIGTALVQQRPHFMLQRDGVEALFNDVYLM